MRVSILTRSVFAIGVLAGSTVIVGLVGILSFAHLEEAIPRFAQTDTDSLVSALRLTSDADELTSLAPKYATIKNALEHNTLDLSRSDIISQLDDTIGQVLKRHAAESSQLVKATRDELVRDILRLDSVVKRRLNVNAQSRKKLRDLRTLRETLDCLDELQAEVSENKRCGDIEKFVDLGPEGLHWMATLDRVYRLTQDMLSDDTGIRLRRTKLKIQAATEHMESLRETISAADATALEPLWKIVGKLYFEQGNIVHLSELRHKLSRQLRGQLNISKFSSSRFIFAVTSLVEDVRAETEAKKAELIARLDLLTRIMLAVLLVCLTAAGLGFVYFKRRVVERILNLQKVVETGIGSGDAVQIPRDDSDEIGKLGIAYSFFLDEIRSREESLREQRDIARYLASEAAEANKAKSSFLANMSHELRTPLNAILGYAQVLEMDRDDNLKKKQIDAVETIMKGGELLLDLINDVLELAAIEQGRIALDVSAVGPATVIADCLEMTRMTAEKYGVTIINETGDRELPLVLADTMRLKQVLLNLTSNATKYNREGGTVTLSCERCSDGQLRIAVRDTGIGIAEESKTDIFEPFNRITQDSSGIEGNGIGLTVTKELVEMMGGNIGFESELGVGSTFWICLPLAQATTCGVATKNAEGIVRNLETRIVAGEVFFNILYVEDNPANLNLLAAIVDETANLTLTYAETGEAGVEKAIDERPDAILMDINLPGISGIEATQRLKADERTKDIPVIAVSANAMAGQIKETMTVGFADYVVKPFVVLELLRKINSVLNIKLREPAA